MDWINRKGIDLRRVNIAAVGDTKAKKVGEEDPWERVCDLMIDGPELTRAVQKLWLEDKYLKQRK